MTQTLDDQLSKLNLKISKEENKYYIPKQQPAILNFEPNHFYVIQLTKNDVGQELLNNAAINWNQGRNIESTFLKCEYIKSLGNMVCLNASGYDPENDIDLPDIYLNIWINFNIITILREI